MNLVSLTDLYKISYSYFTGNKINYHEIYSTVTGDHRAL